MMVARRISRRILQLATVADSAGPCWISGVFGYEVAHATAGAKGMGTGD